MTDINIVNQIDSTHLKASLMDCCHSTAWANALIARRPFESMDDLLNEAHQIWMSLSERDWRGVIDQMPAIGDTKSLARKNDRWSHEHDGVTRSSTHILEQLDIANQRYLEHFGFRYVVFASGKSGPELLNFLLLRMKNSPAEEIQMAAIELAKIMRLRLITSLEKSPITTHILDTSKGHPSSDVHIKLSSMHDGQWRECAQSITNADGRAVTFLPKPHLTANAEYKLNFEVEGCFFPSIDIAFRVRLADDHYHIPLLVSPFGYTTYRGS